MSDLAKQRIPRVKFLDTFQPLSKEHAEALGRVAASWTYIEGYCGSIIQFMLGVDSEAGYAITAEMSFMQRVATISSLMHCTRDQALVDHWEDICPIIDALRTKRNDLIHGEWQIFAHAHIVLRAKARGRVSVAFDAITTDQLTSLEADIIDLVDQLAWFTDQLGKRGFSKALDAGRTMQPLDPTQSHKARVQAQARAEKLNRKATDRERSRAENAARKSPSPKKSA